MPSPHRPERGAVALSVALVVLGASLLLGCSSGSSGKPEPMASDDSKVTVNDACDHSFDAEGATALRKIAGTSQFQIVLPAEQSTVKQVANALQSDLNGTNTQGEHTLCGLDLVGRVNFGLQITYQWFHRSPGDRETASTEESTNFDIAYGASSHDNGAYLNFSCPLSGPAAAKSRSVEVTASASTFGLDAVSHAQKREAEARILYSASVKLADGLGCEGSNLPSTLGMLTPLPLKK
jgi:hypothetical protein